MSYTHALLSGILQGITEFFPISSSGHLVLLHKILGMNGSNLVFDIWLHLGTLLALLVYFSRDIFNLLTIRRNMLFPMAIASLPVMIAGYFLYDQIERLFSNPAITLVMLFVTGIFLLLGHRAGLRNERLNVETKGELNIIKTFLVGIAQAVAIIPGISRSGITISTSLLLGLKREETFRFSFLISIPALTAAILYKGFAFFSYSSKDTVLAYSTGMLASFIVGLFCLESFHKLLQKKRLHLFAYYCLTISSLGIILYTFF